MNYDERNWNLLTNFLKIAENREKIHVMNRIQLMVDAIMFHECDLLDLQIVLDLIDGLKYEAEQVVHRFGLNLILWLDNNLSETQYDLRFQV